LRGIFGDLVHMHITSWLQKNVKGTHLESEGSKELPCFFKFSSSATLYSWKDISLIHFSLYVTTQRIMQEYVCIFSVPAITLFRGRREWLP